MVTFVGKRCFLFEHPILCTQIQLLWLPTFKQLEGGNTPSLPAESPGPIEQAGPTLEPVDARSRVEGRMQYFQNGTQQQFGVVRLNMVVIAINFRETSGATAGIYAHSNLFCT